jgi:hypothetical protein
MTQEEKDKYIAKRRQERMSSNGSTSKALQSLRQANVHEAEDVINIDDIVDYCVMEHDVTSQDNVADGKGDEALSNDAALAYMARRNTGAYLGDIRHVLASNQTPTSSKATSRKVNASSSAPSTVQVGDTTYYLNKSETISVQGHSYSTHMTTCIPYRISQHDVSTMKKALIDRGANGGIYGDDILVLEGSDRFVEFRPLC